MKKKIIGIILALTMTVCVFSPVSAAENSDVEISFRVGDSILKINGADVEVETPYVVGEGTTLVPVRVISEAFGAKVDWDDDTETVSISYEDKNISLQIGNKTAVVNGKSEELLAAPELTENFHTMVPLRFISETLGAEVGYDDATEAITVKKLVAAEPSETQPPKESTKPSATLNPEPSAEPSATLNPDAPMLSDADVKAIKNSYSRIRYYFEQSVLPDEIFSTDDYAPMIADTDLFESTIYIIWTNMAEKIILSTMADSETEYVFSTNNDIIGFFRNASIQCEFYARQNIEKVDFIDYDDGKIVIMTMKDCDELLISKYIGFKYDKKDKSMRMFTLEKSFDSYYMFCEITADSRGSIGVVPCEYDAFVEAVKAGAEPVVGIQRN